MVSGWNVFIQISTDSTGCNVVTELRVNRVTGSDSAHDDGVVVCGRDVINIRGSCWSLKPILTIRAKI